MSSLSFCEQSAFLCSIDTVLFITEFYHWYCCAAWAAVLLILLRVAIAVADEVTYLEYSMCWTSSETVPLSCWCHCRDKSRHFY